MEILLKGFQCDRCGYQWAQRGTIKPVRCAKCKTPYWDIPKQPKEERSEVDFTNEFMLKDLRYIPYTGPLPRSINSQ